jgi:hypothetical protein
MALNWYADPADLWSLEEKLSGRLKTCRLKAGY